MISKVMFDFGPLHASSLSKYLVYKCLVHKSVPVSECLGYNSQNKQMCDMQKS